MYRKFVIKSVEIDILIWILLLYLFRATIPFLKYPFIIFYSGFILYSAINPRIRIIPSIKDFFRIFYLSIILAAILVFAYLFSNKLYLVIFKDTFNAVILLSLFFLIQIHIKSRKDLNSFINRLNIDIIFLSVMISIMILCNLLSLLPNYFKNISDKSSWVTQIGSMSLDYNFALLPILFGMVSIFYLLGEAQNRFKKGILNLLLVLYSITIILSGSRRGVIILLGIIIIILILQFIAYYRKNVIEDKIVKNSRWYLLSISGLLIILWLFIFHTSYTFKNSTLKLLGSKDIAFTKKKCALSLFRYTSIFDRKSTFSDVYQFVWFDKHFDKALDPESGWGTEIHKTVYPLTGENVHIVPSGAIGYLMDSTCNSRYYANSAYSYTLVDNLKVHAGDIIKASVYCFVSKDFDGSLVRISSGGSTYGNIDAEYDVFSLDRAPNIYRFESIANRNQKSETLQGLSQSPPVKDEFNVIDTRFDVTTVVTTAVKDYSPQKSNLLSNGDFKNGSQFWLPEADSTKIETIQTRFGNGLRVSRSNGDGGGYSLRYSGRPIIYHAGHEYQIKFCFKVEKGSAIPFKIGWWVNDNNQGYYSHNLPLRVRSLGDNWYEATCSYKFKETHYNPAGLLNSLENYSTVDIAKVEIIDLNQDNSIPKFVDQLNEILINNRGIWKKLSLRVKCREGDAPVFLFFSKNEAKNLSSLKGYVIFAYPKCEIISEKDSVSSIIFSPERTINMPRGMKDLMAIEGTQVSVKPSQTLIVVNDLKIVPLNTTSIFPAGIPILTSSISPEADIDPVRKLAAKFVSEDTTYYPYKSKLYVDTVSNSFFGPRLMRWNFAEQIYLKEYNITQKIFGGRFDFLNWFGYYFMKDKKVSDYPHNPFLSILLYSGIFGLLVYIIFLIKGIHYYIKYFKDNEILTVFFAITFFFSFFSAGSPFDPPVMGFFVILPFFIHHIHKEAEKLRKTN